MQFCCVSLPTVLLSPSSQACVLLWRRPGRRLRLCWQWGVPKLLQTQQQMHLADHRESLTLQHVYILTPSSLSLSVSDSYTVSLVSRSQREPWSCSPSAFLTWRLTHNVATTIWMFTTANPTWCKNWVAFVELSGLALLFRPQTPWCWRWCLMQRRRVEGSWPISLEPIHT